MFLNCCYHLHRSWSAPRARGGCVTFAWKGLQKPSRNNLATACDVERLGGIPGTPPIHEEKTPLSISCVELHHYCQSSVLFSVCCCLLVIFAWRKKGSRLYLPVELHKTYAFIELNSHAFILHQTSRLEREWTFYLNHSQWRHEQSSADKSLSWLNMLDIWC
jgi:hypothetical protein